MSIAFERNFHTWEAICNTGNKYDYIERFNKSYREIPFPKEMKHIKEERTFLKFKFLLFAVLLMFRSIDVALILG